MDVYVSFLIINICQHLYFFPTRRSSDLGIQGDVLATDNNTVGMGDAGSKSAIQGSNVPNPDEAVPSFNTSITHAYRSEERFSRNAETERVCRLLLEKKKKTRT